MYPHRVVHSGMEMCEILELVEVCLSLSSLSLHSWNLRLRLYHPTVKWTAPKTTLLPLKTIQMFIFLRLDNLKKAFLKMIKM